MPSPPAHSRLRLVPILLAQAVGIACGIAGVKVNSLLLPPAVLGVYGVFLTFAPLGAWIIHAGLVKFVSRHWLGADDRAGLRHEVLAAWARRLPWLALASVGAVLVMARLAAGGLALLWIALFAVTALLSLVSLAQAALQAERAHWRDCAVSVSGSLTRTFAPSLLFFFTGGLLASLWFGFFAHALLTAAVGAWALHRYRSGAAGSAPSQRISGSAYEGPLFNALAVAAWVLAGSNRWIITWFFGETESGYFTLAGGAAIVVASTLGTIFVQYFQPGFFALGDSPAVDRTTLARRVDRVALAYAVASAVAVGLFYLAAPWLVGPLINPNYRAALSWILPGGGFAIATTTAVFYHSMLLAGHRESGLGPVDLTTAGVLVLGGLAAALIGAEWFARWLMFSPLIPWLLTRPLARHYFFQPSATAAA